MDWQVVKIITFVSCGNSTMRKLLTSFSTILIICINAVAQQTFPVNGIQDERNITYAFTNAHIVQDYKTVIDSGMMVIRKDKIVAIGRNLVIPPDAVVMDLKGKYIYPSLIDIYTDYGMPSRQSKLPATGIHSFCQIQPELMIGTKL